MFNVKLTYHWLSFNLMFNVKLASYVRYYWFSFNLMFNVKLTSYVGYHLSSLFSYVCFKWYDRFKS
jgi:hypothetical protein